MSMKKLPWAVLFVVWGLVEIAFALPFILLGMFWEWASGSFYVGQCWHRRNIDRELEIIKWLQE